MKSNNGRIGKWIKAYPEYDWSAEYKCSLCGHHTYMDVAFFDQRDNRIDEYCGGCGAYMEGVQEDATD